MCGLNIVGLRRAGFTPQERLELKGLYHDLFRSRQKFNESLNAARIAYTSEPARIVLDFVAAAKRGICRDTSMGGGNHNENDASID